ncbi:hypothetical protein [Secundilactobacillus kimchicus]|uniref:hypothetical protein n=1 Tax=Secundilactobacillus kimchicus TaxID=528209 RepID=UPI0024362E2D|nr:hypothetical protein [Secundilactobacillus kimchicus]
MLDGDRIVQASVDYEPGTVGGLGLDRLADRVTEAAALMWTPLLGPRSVQLAF